MSITVTDGLVSDFRSVVKPVEVRAPDGRLLGTFAPYLPEPEISEEELQRREDRTTGKWYTAAEVEAKLRELRAAL